MSDAKLLFFTIKERRPIFSLLLWLLCSVLLFPLCHAQVAPGVGSQSGASNLPADAPKFVSNILPPEAARNASTAVVGATAAERKNATLVAQAIAASNGTATLVHTIETGGGKDNNAGKPAAFGSGDIVTVQHGNESTTYVAVSTTVNATNNQTITSLVAGLPVVELQAPWVTSRRLSKEVVPLNYDVFVHPNLTDGSFRGDVACILEIRAPRKTVILHSSALSIIHMELYRINHGNSSLDVTPIPIAEHFFYPQNEFLIIKLKDTVGVGRYTLNIHYNGSMNNTGVGSTSGMYRSTYKTKNNTVLNYMATTQMESTYARRVFPCFDEPTFKATFSISVAHAPKLIALSNMPEFQRNPLHEEVIVTAFEKSPPMSTYLVCIIVTDFKYVETRSTGGTLLRAYGTAEHVDAGHLNYSLTVLKYTVDRYEKYFEISYQLPKLDIVGIPDFQAGAMENWGCITFRETLIIFDPLEASVAAQQSVAITVSHEVAHQWFGNLVTTAWWDSLWLNEGFATRMEFYGVEGLNETDDWRADAWWVVLQKQNALRYDAFISSHPIVDVTLTDPDDIAANFDSIPYDKGASIILMLENFVGPENFRKGIVRFLHKYIYNVATSDDLWTALNEQLADSGCGAGNASDMIQKTNAYSAGSQCVDIKQVMDTWTLQMNYPVLNLTMINATHGLVEQQRFLLNSNNEPVNKTLDKVSAYNYSWYIPVTARNLDTGRQQLVWANQTSAVINLKSSSAVENTATTRPPATMLNIAQTGFYRVNYPLPMWTELADRIAANISVVPDAQERAGLLNDAFEFARSNLVPYSVPFGFMKYLKYERSPAVWLTASNAFKFLSQRLLSVPEAYYRWRELIRNTIRPVFVDIGWQDVGTSGQRRLRELLMSTACYYGDPDCLAVARQMFQDWLYNGTSVPPNFRSAVYKYGMLYAENDKPWQKALERLLATKTPQEVENLMASLASSSQPWQLERLLYLGWNETYVRNQDIVTLYVQLVDNPVALPYAWNYYRNNVPHLVEKLSLNDANFGHLSLDFAERFNEQMQLDEVKTLFDKYPEAGAGRLSRKQALETIANNIAWLRQHNATVVQWLKDQQQQE